MIIQLSAQNAECPKNQLVHIEWLFSLIGIPKQGTKVVEYFTGVMTGSNNPIQSRPRLFKIGRPTAKKSQRRTGIRRYGCHGLSHLM